MLSLMQEQGITRRKMAADVGIGINQIKYWQDNGNVPNALTIEKIADRLGTTPDYLLGKTDEKNKPTGVSADELDEALKRVSEIASTLSEEEKQMWIEFGEMLLRSQNNPRKQ